MAVPAGIWCDNCNRLVPEEELTEGAEAPVCPHCEQEIAEGKAPDADAPPRAPWHFKVLLVGTIGYLIYRLIWFIFWIKQHA